MDIGQVPSSGTGVSDVAWSICTPDCQVRVSPAMKSDTCVPPWMSIAPFSARKIPSVSESPVVVSWVPVSR